MCIVKTLTIYLTPVAIAIELNNILFMSMSLRRNENE
jgi:hypothetical protein